MERRLSNNNEWLYFSFACIHEIKNKNVLAFLARNETRDIKAKQGAYETYNILQEWNLEFRFCQNRILKMNIVWDEDEQ